MTPPHDALAASFVWWSLPFVLTTIVSGGMTMAALEERSGSLVSASLFLLICVTWVRPSTALMLLAHVGSTAIKLSEMPRVWDGTWWFIFLSLPAMYVLSCRRIASLAERDMAFVEMATALRPMCHVLYAGASLLKINRDFLDVEYSCAPILGAQLLTRLPAAWGLDDSPVAGWITRAFPALTVAVEFAVPALTLFVGPAEAMLVGLALHFGIPVAQQCRLLLGDGSAVLLRAAARRSGARHQRAYHDPPRAVPRRYAGVPLEAIWHAALGSRDDRVRRCGVRLGADHVRRSWLHLRRAVRNLCARHLPRARLAAGQGVSGGNT